MTKFSTEVSLTSSGLIDVDATVASVRTALTAAAAAESEQFAVIEEAVDAAVLSLDPSVSTLNLETLTHYALAQLNAVPASDVPEVTRKIKTLIRNSPKFTMAKGKNGGCKINARHATPAPTASAEA